MGSRTPPTRTRDDAIRLARESTSTDLPTAGAFFGFGANTAYKLCHDGEFPCPVIKIGTRYRVPTAGLLVALGIENTIE